VVESVPELLLHDNRASYSSLYHPSIRFHRTLRTLRDSHEYQKEIFRGKCLCLCYRGFITEDDLDDFLGVGGDTGGGELGS
jgi:hypothetical protein